MMKLAKYFVPALFALALAGAGTSCGKEDNAPREIIDPVKPIGSYRFGETDYDIRFGMYDHNDWGYTFALSPLAASSTMTSYFLLGLADMFDGREVDVEHLYHNDDYVFVYEDPYFFYSQYRALESGTLYMKKLKGDTFSLKIDVKLADGTPFTCDFEGELQQATMVE